MPFVKYWTWVSRIRITVYAEAVADNTVGMRKGECPGRFTLPPRNTVFKRGAYEIYYVDRPEAFSAANQNEHYLGTVR